MQHGVEPVPLHDFPHMTCRKGYHLLALGLFLPALLWEPQLLSISLAVAFALLVVLEIIRLGDIPYVGKLLPMVTLLMQTILIMMSEWTTSMLTTSVLTISMLTRSMLTIPMLTISVLTRSTLTTPMLTTYMLLIPIINHMHADAKGNKGLSLALKA